MLLNSVHRALVTLYFALPAMALIWALVALRAGRRQPITSFLVTTLAGAMLAVGVVGVYAFGTNGRAIPTQVLLAGYFAMGLLFLLKCYDWMLTALTARLFGVRHPAARGFATTGRTAASSEGPTANPEATSTETAQPEPAKGDADALRRPRGFGLRIFGMQLVRIVLLFGVGLPYVMASVMTYRPKVWPAEDPMSQLGFRFDRVEFDATDGTKIVGWWIPAPERATRTSGSTLQRRSAVESETDHPWGSQTVIVCHGLAGNKSNQLVMARDLPTEGYNVLIFDFRAHGESGGQLTTFGDVERRDVLGAVRYLQAERPGQSRRILGVGASMGAAALIAAAADASPEGQSIEAVAVYGTYDDLGKLTESVADLYFAPPMDWLLKNLALPLASAQTGAELKRFAPARLVDDLWPRPVLVIHGIDDEIIPFEHGRDLFDAATLPRRQFWLPRLGHNEIITNELAGKAVLEFFEKAEDVPVI